MKEMLLLGAGASVEAGVPDAYTMTQSILNEFRGPGIEKEAQVLAFVLGGLLFQRGIRGENPLKGGINVEELFNAVLLLSERNSLEMAPFVGAWHPMVEEFDKERGAANFDKLQNMIFKNPDTPTHEFQQEFKKVIGSLGERRGTGKIFKDIEFWMVLALTTLVWIDRSERVAHLKPILNLLSRQKRLVVATLNYDNSIELLARDAGVGCVTGIDTEWVEGSFNFSGDGLFLLKLHGSIDWQRLPNYRHAQSPMPRTVILRATEAEMREGSRAYVPAVIFGHRNKLTVEGPFLELLRAFQKELDEKDQVTVVGYSFRDAHINEYISLWLNKKRERKLRIISPHFFKHTSEYAQQLVNFCGRQIEVIQETAGRGLQQLYPA